MNSTVASAHTSTDRIEIHLAPVDTRHVIRFELDDAILNLLSTVLPTFGSIASLFASLEETVSVLSDKIAAATAAFDAAIARDMAEDTANQAKIAELQALVDAGGATPADLQALDDLKAKADALNVTNPAVITAPVAAAIKAKHPH